ncbi:uncharacterized protein LOC111320809 [Stylophora pistillata]|uniref:uncharacterized protein LOC111320809 n=1 Tax=Stylophora pistillata TaxID=50429 RepID=UPI000C03CFD0|nr:uncharacterized protein LOC111320809 [Stylophora pistillata]
MAEAKSVRFSPIIEESPDDISTASSNTDFFPHRKNMEDIYIASLTKSAKKYHLPNENEQRLIQRRKKGLLALGFVLLLGITAVGIYFVTRELSNQEPYLYSGAAVERGKHEFASRNMTLHYLSYSTIIMDSPVTKKPSLEYSRTQASMPSVKASHILPSKPRSPITRMFTPTTTSDSTSLRKITDTKWWNTSSFLTPSFAFVVRRSSYFVMKQDSLGLISYAKTINSPFVTQGSSWEDYHTKASIPFVGVNSITVFPTSTASSVGDTRSSIPDISGNSSFGHKAGTLAISVGPYSPPRNATSVKGSQQSFYSRYASPWYASQIAKSTDIAPSKSDSNSKSASNNFQLATKKGEFSKYFYARLSFHPSGSASKSRNSTEVATSRTLLETTLELPKGVTKVLTNLTSTRIMNSPSEDRSLDLLNQIQTSHSRSSTALKNITREMFIFSSSNPSSSHDHKMHSHHRKSSSLMQTSLSSKVSQDTDALPSYLREDQLTPYTSIRSVARGAITQKQSSQKSFKESIQKTMFPSASFSDVETISTSLREIKTNSRPSPLISSQESDVVSLQATSDNGFHSISGTISPLETSHNIHAGHNSETLTVRQITSLKSTGPLASVLQTSPSYENKTLFDTTLLLMTRISSNELSVLHPLSSHFLSPAVKPVSPYASSSMHVHQGISSTVVSKTTTSFNFSSRYIYRNSFNFSSTRGHISAYTDVNSRHTGNVGFSTIPVRSTPLTSEASPSECVSTPNLFKGASMQTSTKGTSDKPTGLKGTSISTLSVSASNPSATLPKDVGYFSRSLPIDKMDEMLTSSKAWESKIVLLNITAAHSLIITPSSSVMSLSSTRGKTSSKATWQGMNAWDFRVGASAFKNGSWKSSTDSLRTTGLTIYNFPSLKTTASSPNKDSSNTATIWKFTNSISTGPSSVQSSALSLNPPPVTSSIKVTSMSSSEIPWNISALIRSLNATAHRTSKLPSNLHYTSTSYLKWIHQTTDPYPSSSVKPTILAISNSSNQFQIMDGSLLITNREFHANLSNPNSTMFKVLAVKVEAIVEDIISVDVKVTSFEEGSIIPLFNLKVPHGAPYNDSDYAELLTAANETLWRGLKVTNINITSRVYKERAESQNIVTEENRGLSNATLIAIFSVLSVLLITVGVFGFYVCKKKGYYERSTVKPADSPIPPSELRKTQPVRRDTWVMSDEPFLKKDVPKDHDQRSASFYETLSMRVLERNDDNKEGSCDPDLLRKSTNLKRPFEPDCSSGQVANFASGNAFRSTSRCTSSSHLEFDDSERPVSGSSRETYLNVAGQSSHSENECYKCDPLKTIERAYSP